MHLRVLAFFSGQHPFACDSKLRAVSVSVAYYAETPNSALGLLLPRSISLEEVLLYISYHFEK